MAKRKPLPAELENVASIEDVNAIQEKVDKCYSKERYEDFQTAVEKIIDRHLKSIIGWSVFVWLASLLGSMFLQKIFNIF